MWTSLTDPRQAPALDLARLYAQRWEQEIFSRELKQHLRRTDLLQSHTLETAAQKLAAIVLASALLAVERTRVVNGMWSSLDVAAPFLTEKQT